METHEYIILVAGCIFSGIVAMDVVIKNRRKSRRDRLDRRTRQEMLDEIDQMEWDVRLDKKYSTFCSWYMYQSI